jgi:carboxymethylenebutenolidase
MKVRAAVVTLMALAALAGGRYALAQHGARPGQPMLLSRISSPVLVRAGLPSEGTAKVALSAALGGLRHPQWIDIPVGTTMVRSFVVFPVREDKQAPVVVVTANNQGMSDWLRAVGDDAASNGFIAVVPDLLSGMGPNGGGTNAFANPDAIVQALDKQQNEIARRAAAVRAYAVTMPGSTGKAAEAHFHFAEDQSRIETTVIDPQPYTAKFNLTDHAWHQATAMLSARLDVPRLDVKKMPLLFQAAAAGRGGGDGLGGMRSKRPDLPANFLMAAKTVAQSPRKGEWLDIPMASGMKLHTWISYPQNVAQAPVVLVFQPGPGMDMGEPITPGGGANWLRAIADQLAYEGFIAVLPDLTSGLGPNGGNYDSFKFPDDSGAALNKIPHSEVLNRIRVARDYALKFPMANGKLGVTGFCNGGALAWESAAEIEGVSASVVFYGGPPKEEVMARIKAPVSAYYGADDLGLAPTIEPSTAAMKRLNKPFDVHVYQDATHVFLYRQDLGKNTAATEDAWPKAMAFFKRYLRTAN